MATSAPGVLWEHPNKQSTNMYKFQSYLEKRRKTTFPSYKELHGFSIDRPLDFWADLFAYVPMIYDGDPSTVVTPSNARIDAHAKWFPNVTLNFAENVLYTPTHGDASKRSTTNKEDSKIATVEVREGGSAVRPFTWKELRERVSLFASAMRAHGLVKGDRVAVVMGNSIDCLCVFLAATSVGGLFSSSSTDMGSKGILERLRQVRPKWVFVDDGALYNGKTEELAYKMKDIIQGMEGIEEFREIVSVPRWEKALSVKGLARVVTLESYLSRGRAGEIKFERVPFGTGFLIVYSSGTTGQPKCIVHSTGGVILSSLKEGGIHREMDSNSRVLQYTTTGWIMYLVSVSALMIGATYIMYDGSPFQPKTDYLLRLVADQKVSHLGISPRWLSTLQTARITPAKSYNLSALKLVTCTGMVLPPSLFKWFYSAQGFPSRAQIANISGGTDLAGAFGDCNAMMPIYETGGCQCASLGLDVRVYDQTVEGNQVPGKEVEIGMPGELVCVKPFPNMPVQFYGDPDGSKYQNAYFARFDNVWTHGDFIYLDPATRAFIFLGRADGVLNPSGVRFGSAEIYTVIENNFESSIEDSICVGQRRPNDQDEKVVLFLKMRPGHHFNAKIVQEVRTAIEKSLSKRHVPKYVFETREIPSTVNGKKVELPVKRIISGEKIKPSGTLANPESLNYYYQFVESEKMDSIGRSKL